MSVTGAKRQVVYFFQLCDLFKGFLGKRRLAFERMQYDVFQQVTQGPSVQQEPSVLSGDAFRSEPRLHSFYLSHELRSANDTHVPWYTYTRFGQ